MKDKNKKFLIKLKPSFIEELKRKKETAFMLVLASILGVLASLVANIIENFFIGNKDYGLTYSLVIILSFVLILFFLIKIFWKWKPLIMLYKNKQLLKKIKKFQEKNKESAQLLF